MALVESDIALKSSLNRRNVYQPFEMYTPKKTFGALLVIITGLVTFAVFGANETAAIVAAAAAVGVYMALNIGANDVANNVGPAVGSGALTLGGAIAIAAVFETMGALLAGGDVVSTISKGIIDPSLIPNSNLFVLAMGSALLAGALWLNLATWLGAPVSTTHSIVGGVLGAGVAAAGFGVVDWGVMSKIAASWFLSPVLGGVIAALFLGLIERVIFSRKDMLAASRRWVPVFLGVMVAAFSVYLTIKGLKKIWKPEMGFIVSIGVGALVLSSVVLRPIVANASQHLHNRRAAVNTLFNIPLIFSVALLSFAHGANDVANAVGPLSAIVSAVSSNDLSVKVGIPFWVMMIGALGIAVGLMLFGAKLIRTVGSKLTALDQTRAFCICLSAAITVIAASALGLPVSSTHIAIGSVFGIGFYREFHCNSKNSHHRGIHFHLNRIVQRIIRKEAVIPEYAENTQRKPRKLVRRRKLLTIVAAWFITVPCAAALAAALYSTSELFFG